MTQFCVPVAFIIFNRPELTERVFQEIRRLKPQMLLVVADGPRSGKQGEAERCAATRTVIDQVDWPCTVLKNYSDANLGCRGRVSSGLDWVFEQVEEAIVLEDDCLPSPDFFSFCERMLERYRHDQRVMHIGGTNFQAGRKRGDGDYYFSRLTHIWGWATWRRAWRYYDVDLKRFPAFRKMAQIANTVPDQKMQDYWMKHFELIHRNEFDTWDFQWTFAVWHQNGLSVIPNENLISNLGFGSGATHTHDAYNIFAEMQVGSVDSYIAPSCVLPEVAADYFTFETMTKRYYYRTLRFLLDKAIRLTRSMAKGMRYNG